MQHRLIALIPLLFCLTGTAVAAEAGAYDACGSLPLLDRYERAGLLSRATDGGLQLHLVADLHAADCGAPDCYGTDIVVTMKSTGDRGQCRVTTAVVQTQEFAEAGCGDATTAPSPTTEVYSVSEAGADMSSRGLEQVTLRNADGSRALVIMRQNFLYFDHVTADGVLHTELPAGDEKGCCWGASSSETHFSKANGRQ